MRIAWAWFPSHSTRRHLPESRWARSSVRLVRMPISVLVLLALGSPIEPPADTVPMGSGIPSVRAAIIVDPPVIDGHLDEEVWEAAVPLSGFTQNDPMEGEPASEATEVRVLHDSEALYVGAWLWDREADAIVAGERRRDADLEEGDAFLILLDTFRDGESAYVFGTNPLGIEFDGQVAQDGLARGGSPGGPDGSGGAFNLEWDGDWEVATSRDEEGWYVEMRIPFSTLRYEAGPDVRWGLNAARYLRRRSERAFWAPIPRQYNLFRVSMAGELTGLDAPTVRSAFLTPYVLATAREPGVDGSGWEYPREFGGDLKVEVSPTLTLDLTYNTDFAQVEVDEERVDLSRFNVFFPEKRPFFLENAAIFSVGDPGFVEVFHTRRIGIGDDGLPIPILGGGRLSGSIGGQEVGMLHIRTDDVEGRAAGQAYSVARLSRRLPSRSRIGVMVTDRRGEGPDDENQALALDGRWGLGENLTLDGYVAATRTPGLDGRNHTTYLNLDYQGRVWEARSEYMELGEDFNPELGFLRRSGFRVGGGFLQRRMEIPSVHWLRDVRPNLRTLVFFDFDGFEETRSVRFRLPFLFENGARFTPGLSHSLEGLQDPFPVVPGVVVPAGSYSNFETQLEFNTDESAPLALSGRLGRGGFLSGQRTGVTLGMAARSAAAVTTGVQMDHNRVRLPEGDFKTTLVGLRFRYAFTPRMALQSLVQYSDQAELWSTNLRFSWTTRANTGLFLVINDIRSGRDRGEVVEPTRPDHRLFTAKFSRQLGGWSLPGG